MKKIFTIALFACIGAAVVSCGGSDSSTSSNTTGTFTATGMMSSARSMPTANLLENGQVLVAGGVGSASIAVGSADLYDPATHCQMKPLCNAWLCNFTDKYTRHDWGLIFWEYNCAAELVTIRG